MTMKQILFSFFTLLLSLFLCAACSDDDSPLPEKELPVINYFRGTVNGQYVCFECHDRYICPIDINIMSYWPGESIPVEFTVGIPIPPVENLENGGRLYFSLTPARTGLYEIYPQDEYVTSKLVPEVYIAEPGISFVADEHEPFRIYVDKLWVFDTLPYIKGRMEGTLHSLHDASKTVVFEDVEFRAGHVGGLYSDEALQTFIEM